MGEIEQLYYSYTERIAGADRSNVRHCEVKSAALREYLRKHLDSQMAEQAIEQADSLRFEHEKYGFICGFQCAMQIAAESFIKQV